MNMKTYIETLLACVTALALFEIFKIWMQSQIKKIRTPKPPPPHPLNALFDHLKSQGIPFQVMKGDPATCQCPDCTAARERNKNKGGDHGRTLH